MKLLLIRTNIFSKDCTLVFVDKPFAKSCLECLFCTDSVYTFSITVRLFQKLGQLKVISSRMYCKEMFEKHIWTTFSCSISFDVLAFSPITKAFPYF